MIKKDDYFIVMESADGKSVAIPAGTKDGLTGDKFFAVRTADGFKVPCAVGGELSNGDSLFPVGSADGERVAVPLGGGEFESIPLPFSKGESLNSYFSWNGTTGVLSYDGGSSDFSDEVFKFAYWKSSDNLGISEPIDRVFPDGFIATLPEFKNASMTTSISQNNIVRIRSKFITAPFDVNGSLASVEEASAVFPTDIELRKFRSSLGDNRVTIGTETDGVMWVEAQNNIPFATTYGIIITVSIDRILYLSDFTAEFFKDPNNRTIPTIIRVDQ
jgi:hypothetical protein